MTNPFFRSLFIGASALVLAACGADEPVEAGDDAASAQEETASAPDSAGRLQAVLDAQPDDAKARYQYRHPAETLAFFGIEPGMTVVDTLPGKVWYAGILSDYLGADGKVIGADYAIDMWPRFGGFATPEFVDGKRTWTETWVADMESGRDEGDAGFAAFQFGELPADMEGVADAALMVRALHNLHRFEDEGAHLSEALADMNAVLKPGGLLGVIQHRAPEDNADAWADGSNGYLKQSRVIEAIEAAGFELADTSEINANPDDQPTEDDFVWRLPPSLGDSEDDPERRDAMMAIGESDRMTLLFRKPE